MWYVIQVQTGREEQIIEEAGKYQVQEYFDSMFAPHCVKKKKYLGQWHTQQEILFPGYLFVISSRPEELYQASQACPEAHQASGDRREVDADDGGGHCDCKEAVRKTVIWGTVIQKSRGICRAAG